MGTKKKKPAKKSPSKKAATKKGSTGKKAPISNKRGPGGGR